MENEDNLEIDVCDDILNKSAQLDENAVINDNLNVIVDKESIYLTSPELYTLRRQIYKNKGKDDDLENHKGPKVYAPEEIDQEDRIMENLLKNHKKSLKLERCAKLRDCIKAEWNEELKIVLVPHLKGKSTQHMGHNFNGKIALCPEEALFLLEKNFIEVKRNNMPMSIEEAYSVMLKGKLGLEKYQVYSHLSQQGFIVVKHQSRYEEVMNSNKAKLKKRKTVDGQRDGPPEKRLTFTGILAPNLELNASINAEGNANLSSDCEVLNSSDSLNKNDAICEASLNNDAGKLTDALPATGENVESIIASQSDAISPDSTNRVEFINFIENKLVKNPSEAVKQTNDNEAKTVNDVPVSIVETSIQNINEVGSSGIKVPEDINTIETNIEQQNNSNSKIKVSGSGDAHQIGNKQVDEDSGVKLSMNLNGDQNNSDIKMYEVINVQNNEELNGLEQNRKECNEVEKADDTNDVIFEEEIGKNDDINVDDFSSDYGNSEYSSDESELVVCEETSDQSLDILSCSTSDQQSGFEELSSQSNLFGGPSKEHDDEVTLVEIKKKESKPLAVIDLLSDEEQEDKNNGEEFEGSDDDIQVVKVCPVANTIQSNPRILNSLKSECKKERTPIKCSSDIKSSFRPQMKFPDMFSKEVLCLPRPPANLLPNHVRPAKEAYVINLKKSAPSNKGRVWSSYKDMQDYQRQKRLDRQFNSMPQSLRHFRFRNNNDFHDNRNSSRDVGFGRNYQNFPFEHDSHPSRNSPFNRHENSREINFDRNNQSYSFQQNTNSFNNQEQVPALLPSPVFPQMPAMNMNNLHNLSASNPAALVSEIQKTVFSVATTMLNTMLGQHLNPMSRSSPTFNELPMMGRNSHNQFNNFATSSPVIQDHMAFNADIRTDFHPIRFPPESSFSGERFPYSGNRGPMVESSWRPPFHQRNFERRGPLFPCPYREVQRKRCWDDVKAAVEGSTANVSDSGSDIEEVPINLNQFLWSNDIQPLMKPGSKIPVSEVLKKLQITQMAKLFEGKINIEKYLPEHNLLDISYDVYLPGSKYKKTAPDAPKHRIIVLRASDPIPKYSEIVFLQNKWNDGAFLQMAVVDHGDISFYSLNGIYLPELEPHKS